MKFPYFVQLILQQLNKKKLVYFIIFLMVLISSLLLVISSLLIDVFGMKYRIFKGFKDHDVLFSFYGSFSSGLLSISGKTEPYDEILKYGNLSAEVIYDTPVYLTQNIEHSEVMLYLYGDIMSKNMVLNLRKGEQLFQAKIKDNAYPIIVPEFSEYAKYYGTGETFDIYYVDWSIVEKLQVKDKRSLCPIKVYVCGVLSYPYYVYRIGLQGVPSSIENVYNSPGQDEFFVSGPISFDDGSSLKDITRTNHQPTAIVKIDAEKNSDEYRAIYEALDNNYGVISIDELLDKGFENYVEGVADYILIIVILVLLSAFGLSGINLFLLESSKKEYSLYFMCGADWEICILIEAVKNLLLVLIPSMIGVSIATLYIISEGPETYCYLNVSNIFLTVIFMVLMTFSSTAYFLIKLKKTKPIENIRLMVKE